MEHLHAALSPSVSKTNGQAVLGYLVGKLTVEVLKNCGDDLSRENIMRQARLLKGIQLPMMVQGIKIDTSPSDHAPIEQMRMMRFTNGQWQHFGPVRSGVDAGAVSESFKTIFKYGTATKRDLANQLNANTVSLMTGSFGSTYAQVGADLASVLDNGTSLRILPVMGRGSVQAVADILLLRGVDAGIVRKDTLVLPRPQGLRQGHPQPVRLRRQDVQRGNARPGAEDDHQHEGARRQDRGGRFARQLDLRDGDQRVRPARDQAASDLSRAAAGGGHAAQGRGRRDRGDRRQAAAMAEPDQRPQSASGAGRIREAAAGGVSAFQAWLGGLPGPGGGGWLCRDHPAEAVLASYNWAPNSDRYRRLSLLVDTMFDKVAQLQRPPFHPKWKEMAPRATVSGWTRFKAAQEWLDRNMPPPAGTAAASGAAPVLAPAPVAAPAAALAPQEQRDPLYREFLEWRASRAKAAPIR